MDGYIDVYRYTDVRIGSVRPANRRWRVSFLGHYVAGVAALRESRQRRRSHGSLPFKPLNGILGKSIQLGRVSVGLLLSDFLGLPKSARKPATLCEQPLHRKPTWPHRPPSTATSMPYLEPGAVPARQLVSVNSTNVSVQDTQQTALVHCNCRVPSQAAAFRDVCVRRRLLTTACFTSSSFFLWAPGSQL